MPFWVEKSELGHGVAFEVRMIVWRQLGRGWSNTVRYLYFIPSKMRVISGI